MNFVRRLFTRPKTSNKPARPDSPTNKVIKKFLFYGFFLFTTVTIISKKYKTKLIFTFQPTEQNKKIIEYNPVFHQGVYNPVYWMLFGPMQRFYAKYIQQGPYFRSTSEPATKQLYQIHSTPVHDKYLKKENLSVALLVAGCEGLDLPMQKLMVSLNSNGFNTICIKPDDFHNTQKLQKTIDKIRNQNPNSKIYGIGVDYGANLLVNLAAKNQKALNAIVSLGNPLNLEQSEKKIQNSNFIWKNLLYKDMLKGRIQACQQNRSLYGQTLRINPQITSLYELDRECYNGSYDDYPNLKQKLSSINQVKNLKIPSLFIQSQQDPFSISIEQNEQKLQNSKCIFVQTPRGGHQEWFQSMKKIRWVSRPIAQFLKYLQTQL